MQFNTDINTNHGEVIGQIGWKYYNSIKKKAMEQEFSWAGLALSLSIAFFIVIMAASVLNFFYESLRQADLGFLEKGIISETIQQDDTQKAFFEKVKMIESASNQLV